MLLDVKDSKVLHLKALLSGNLRLLELKQGSTFILYQCIMKNAILQHTEALVKIEVASTSLLNPNASRQFLFFPMQNFTSCFLKHDLSLVSKFSNSG